MDTLEMTEAAPQRRSRGARPQRGHGGQKLGVPYIARNIPTYDILSEENLV